MMIDWIVYRMVIYIMLCHKHIKLPLHCFTCMNPNRECCDLQTCCELCGILFWNACLTLYSVVQAS